MTLASKNYTAILATLVTVAFLLVSVPAVVQAATFNVSNSSGLQNALNQASGGDTIVLASGSYGSVTISESYSSAVMIRSASNQGARFSTFYIKNSSNIEVSGISVSSAPSALSTGIVEISDSDNITLRNSVIEASSYRKGAGVIIEDSQNIDVINNRIGETGYGMRIYRTSDLLVQGNEIHNFGEDAVQYTAGVNNQSNVTYVENYIHTPDPLVPFEPVGGSHPDAFQFTNTNNGGTLSNLRVVNNLLVANNMTTSKAPDGNSYGSYFQGVFIGSQCVNGAQINNNFIYTNQIRGISSNGCSSGVVANGNTVLPTQAGNPQHSGVPIITGVSGGNNVFTSNGPSGNGNIKLNLDTFRSECYSGLPRVPFSPAAINNSNAIASCSAVQSGIGFQGNSWTGGGSVPVGTGDVPGGGGTFGGDGGGGSITVDGVVTQLENASDEQLAEWLEQFGTALGGAGQGPAYVPPEGIDDLIRELLELVTRVNQLQRFVLDNHHLASPQIVGQLNQIAVQLAVILQSLR